MRHISLRQFDRSFWPALLVASSAIGTLGFACVTPFPAFAVAAAYVLPLRSALLCVTGVWLVNQVIGFSMLGYPWAADTLLWGAAIGIAAVAATALADAMLRPQSWHPVARLGAGLVAAFAGYQALLLGVTFGLGGMEAFTPTIIAQYALVNLLWAAALLGARELPGYMSRTPLPPVFARR
jgi:hypothetical protein